MAITIKIIDTLNGVMIFKDVDIRTFNINNNMITIIEIMEDGKECLFEFPTRYTKSITIEGED